MKKRDESFSKSSSDIDDDYEIFETQNQYDELVRRANMFNKFTSLLFMGMQNSVMKNEENLYSKVENVDTLKSGLPKRDNELINNNSKITNDNSKVAKKNAELTNDSGKLADQNIKVTNDDSEVIKNEKEIANKEYVERIDGAYGILKELEKTRLQEKSANIEGVFNIKINNTSILKNTADEKLQSLISDMLEGLKNSIKNLDNDKHKQIKTWVHDVILKIEKLSQVQSDNIGKQIKDVLGVVRDVVHITYYDDGQKNIDSIHNPNLSLRDTVKISGLKDLGKYLLSQIKNYNFIDQQSSNLNNHNVDILINRAYELLKILEIKDTMYLNFDVKNTKSSNDSVAFKFHSLMYNLLATLQDRIHTLQSEYTEELLEKAPLASIISLLQEYVLKVEEIEEKDKKQDFEIRHKILDITDIIYDIACNKVGYAIIENCDINAILAGHLSLHDVEKLSNIITTVEEIERIKTGHDLFDDIFEENNNIKDENHSTVNLQNNSTENLEADYVNFDSNTIGMEEDNANL